MSTTSVVVDASIVDLLRARGPMQSCAINAALPAITFRQVDGSLRRLRSAGKILLLPRIRGERPFPLWKAAS